MHIRTIFMVLFLPLAVLGQSRETELLELSEQIRNDQSGHDFLLSLKPTLDDFQGLFQTGNDVEDVWMYTQETYIDLGMEQVTIPENYTEKEVITVMAVELGTSENKGLPAEYNSLVDHFKPTIKVYALRFHDPESKENMLLDGFYHVNRKWVYIPATYNAFQ